MRLSGTRALITGAAQGIGLAIAERFLEEDAKVVCVDLRECPVGQSITWDLKETETLWSLVNAAEEHLQGINHLVNCAGICPTEPMLGSEIETWESVFRINTFASFFLTQELSKRWLKSNTKGSIINLASVSGFLPKTEQTLYGASKAAVISITRSAAAVLGPHGIRVNAIAPGVIDTPLTQSIARKRGELRGVDPISTLSPVIDTTPLRRIGDAKEIAELAVFLASAESSYITGQTIVADGGFLMR